MQAALKVTKAETSSSSSTSGEFKRQGSLRRVLPPETNVESKMLVHDIETDKLRKIFHQEYTILAEYKMLQTENIQGVYVIPSYKSSFYWFGVIFVRTGLYEDGIFRFSITLPDKFPEGGHPRVHFDHNVFHPLINAVSGELNITAGFPEWRKGEDHIWHLLKYIIYIFLNVDYASKFATNSEARDLYLNDREHFNERVHSCIAECNQRIYDKPRIDDKHYIEFSPYDETVHNRVRLAILEQPKQTEHNNRSNGFSWVEPGTFKPLSKPINHLTES